MELTALDKELLDGLQVLTDQEIGRVQAHLAAGLPMKIGFGWDDQGTPACFGCVAGTAMSEERYFEQIGGGNDVLNDLAYGHFPDWVRELEGWPKVTIETWEQHRGQSDRPLSLATLNRLGALLDMEWSRRHPATLTTAESHSGFAPAEYGQEAILPTLKEAVLA